jgi:hypothetical protein
MKLRLYISAIAFALFYMAVSAVAKLQLGAVAGVTASIAAVLCLGWFIIEEVATMRCLDELQRRIQLEALAIAFPASILLLVGLSFLQQFIALAPNDWSFHYVWPFFILFYCAGLVFAKTRYR